MKIVKKRGGEIGKREERRENNNEKRGKEIKVGEGGLGRRGEERERVKILNKQWNRKR